MRSRLPAALGAALFFSFVGAAAQAQDWDSYPGQEGLPPVSGTLHVDDGDFGGARPFHAPRQAYRPDVVQVVRGGLYPDETDQVVAPSRRWATGGTGVSGIVGNTGNPYFGQARWGTADSATSGTGFSRGYAWQRRGLFTSEPPLTERYGELPVYVGASYGGEAYGATPQLPFYGSGTPYSMAYYSSGSSAGPYGSPGGLATYRSGSYGYGPRVIRTGAYRGAGYGRHTRLGCTCGPRIAYPHRRHRYYSER